MRIWSLIAATLMGGLLATPALAQGENAAGPKPVIGVVDIGYILKNHPTMKSQMEQIQSQMAAADKAMGDKRDAIVKQMEALQGTYTEGTPEYDQAEKKIAEQDTVFRLELVMKRKEFETAQADLLYRVHSEIEQLIKYYADNMGFQAVLRATREKMDPKKPETIQLVMSQEVLYYTPKADFTDWVLEALKSRASTAAAGAPNRK